MKLAVPEETPGWHHPEEAAGSRSLSIHAIRDSRETRGNSLARVK
jgi:hypothetical protein